MQIQTNILKTFSVSPVNNFSGISDFYEQISELFSNFGSHYLFEPDGNIFAFEPDGNLFIFE